MSLLRNFESSYAARLAPTAVTILHPEWKAFGGNTAQSVIGAHISSTASVQQWWHPVAINAVLFSTLFFRPARRSGSVNFIEGATTKSSNKNSVE
jgi:hypothetical protein